MEAMNGYIIGEELHVSTDGLYVPDTNEVGMITDGEYNYLAKKVDGIQLPDGKIAIKEDLIIARTKNA